MRGRQVFMDSLVAHGVDCIFGNPGTTESPLLDSLVDHPQIDYYVAFSSWRLAVISEGVYARYLHGAMGDQVDEEALALFKQGTEDLAAKALEAMRRLQ